MSQGAISDLRAARWLSYIAWTRTGDRFHNTAPPRLDWRQVNADDWELAVDKVKGVHILLKCVSYTRGRARIYSVTIKKGSEEYTHSPVRGKNRAKAMAKTVALQIARQKDPDD